MLRVLRQFLFLLVAIDYWAFVSRLASLDPEPFPPRTA